MKSEMAMVVDSSYQQMEPSPNCEDEDPGEAPRDFGVMIHVVPESAKSRWNHIEDLDSFFTRMYHYHQNHGFRCMMVQEILELGKFFFVVAFSILLFDGIDYDVLFRKKTGTDEITISDAILPPSEMLKNMGLLTWISITVAIIFWILRTVKVVYHFYQFLEIKSFYNTALKIEDHELDNLTWHEVQKKVIEVQKEQEMCIHKRDLTELDIYHRILRFKNYTVAMINKSLLPVRLNFPLIGDVIFLTRGLKYNLELLLFWGPWSPFENSWHLREDYKKLPKRQELARSLSRNILYVGLANLVLSPLIFFWQILYFFFNYGELVKREPGVLAMRMWSSYGRLYLRHFNELDHELNSRLNRAFRPASKYMSMFTSPLMSIIAKNIQFITGSICVVFVSLTLWDEDFLTVKHVIAIIAGTGCIAAMCSKLLPDENLVWCPESYLTAVLAHTHYRPDSWRNQAHTQTTRAQVAQLFQYKAVHILEELISPLLTPYVLIFHLRHKATDIVDFYRNFTVEITGVGDVCSFAQMDIRKHGNPVWQAFVQSSSQRESEMAGADNLGFERKEEVHPQSNQYTQAEDGKTELSLIHFTHTNPEWKPPSHAENFVTALRERAKKEATTLGYSDANPLYASLNSLSSLGPEYNDVVTNLIRSTMLNQANVSSMNSNYDQSGAEMPSSASMTEQNIMSRMSKTMHRRNVNKAEGPLNVQGERSLLYGLQQARTQPLNVSGFGSAHQDLLIESTAPIELNTVDMSLSTLYLHELHHRQVQRRGFDVATRSIWQRNPIQDLTNLPERSQERAPLLRHQDSSVRSHRQP